MVTGSSGKGLVADPLLLCWKTGGTPLIRTNSVNSDKTRVAGPPFDCAGGQGRRGERGKGISPKPGKGKEKAMIKQLVLVYVKVIRETVL